MAEERGGPVWEKMWQGYGEADETNSGPPIAPSPEAGRWGGCPTIQVLPGWDIGQMCSCKKNRGCFLSLKTSGQATPTRASEDGEAELRVRAGRAGGARHGLRTRLVSRERTTHR